MKRNLLFLLFTLNTCGLLAQEKVHSEFRGVWIATVANIDWPESGDVDRDSQKQGFRELLDYYKGLNFNTVIVQIRTAGDALYPTELAPWSRFLTGLEGDAGSWEGEDPLQFMIEETHKRGMDFHAWLNPYRATFDSKTRILSKSHVYHQHPEWIVSYGPKYYINPGIPEARAHIVTVVGDVVERYDIDGIHFDDYFYPYKIDNEEFNDRRAFVKYGVQEFSDRDDWRRNNVDLLVKETYELIKSMKPWVQFGISPFGVWRNSDMHPLGSDTNAKQTNYDDLYADPLNWVKNRWVDYLVPQLYWSMDFEPAAYRILAEWWNKNVDGVDVYTGIGAYKYQNNFDQAWNSVYEIPRQIELNRKLENINGTAFFSAKSLMEKPRLAHVLKRDCFDKRVLPKMVKVQSATLPKPVAKRVRTKNNTLYIELEDIPYAAGVVPVALNGELGLGEEVFGTFESTTFQIPLTGYRMKLTLAFKDRDGNLGETTRAIWVMKDKEKWKIL